MGTFNKGILGGFSGKVGTVIGSNWRGLNVMRSLPKKSNTNPSQKQVVQREKFAAIIGFLSPLTALLSEYYGGASGVSSRLNNAVSYHLKQALVGDSPDFMIDYTKVLVSKGEVIGVKDGAMETLQPATVNLQWANNSGQVLAEATDVLLAVVYNSDKEQFIISGDVAQREDMTAAIAVPAAFTGDTVHVWLSFVNPLLNKASTSVYLGAAVIS